MSHLHFALTRNDVEIVFRELERFGWLMFEEKQQLPATQLCNLPTSFSAAVKCESYGFVAYHPDAKESNFSFWYNKFDDGTGYRTIKLGGPYLSCLMFFSSTYDHQTQTTALGTMRLWDKSAYLDPNDKTRLLDKSRFKPRVVELFGALRRICKRVRINQNLYLIPRRSEVFDNPSRFRTPLREGGAPISELLKQD